MKSAPASTPVIVSGAQRGEAPGLSESAPPASRTASAVAVSSPESESVPKKTRVEELGLSKSAQPASRTAPPCTPSVTIRAIEEGDLVAIQIEDNGPGLANPDNLFVPLYTTKKSGSGVGLALARQIVEAHGGVIDLRNKPNHQGCIAEVRIPLAERQKL